MYSLFVLADVEDVSEGVRSSDGVWVGEMIEFSEGLSELRV